MTENILATERGGVHYWVAGPAGAGGGTRGTTSGGAVPIVFTHGATMDHEMFDSQVDRFSGDRIVISWDVPAHGKSRPYSDFTLKAAADDLAAILDAEKIENAHLVGQSMGGYISQVFAVEFPERVASFCALDSSPLRGDYYSGLDRWMLSITPAILGLYPYGMLVRTIANQVSVSEAGRAYALRTLETYAPDIRGKIVGSELLTPEDIEREYRISGGHWHHGELSLDQFLMMRPAPKSARYRTPVEGLYFCSAGAHPGGGVMGCAGRNAAAAVLAQ